MLNPGPTIAQNTLFVSSLQRISTKATRKNEKLWDAVKKKLKDNRES